MNTTLELELRQQINVIRYLATRVISAERGYMQEALHRVAKALEKHLPAPGLTAEQKLQTIRAELQEHYRRLEMNPENAPEHFARLRSAVETIVGRKAVSAIPEAEAHYPPMKVEETDGAKAQREKSEQFALVRSMPTHCPKCNSTNFIKSGNGWRCGGSFGDGCGWACVVVEEAPGPFPETTNITRRPITVERPSLDSAALALMKKSAETLRERVNMLHDRGWSKTASTVEGVAAELESFCESAEDATLRAKETPESSGVETAESYKTWFPLTAEKITALEKERDDLKARLAHYEDAYRRIDVFMAQNKELRRQAAEWERKSEEHEGARNLLQREVDRLSRERDQLREDLATEAGDVGRLRKQLEVYENAISEAMRPVQPVRQEARL